MKTHAHQDLIQRMFADFLKMDDDTDLDLLYRDELAKIDMGEFLVAIFHYRPGSLPGNVIRLTRCLVIDLIQFEDILRAYRELQEDSLAGYYFVGAMQFTFGIDFHAMDLGKFGLTKSGREQLLRMFLPQVHAPIADNGDWLEDYGVTHQSILDKMESQGAPVVKMRPRLPSGQIYVTNVHPPIGGAKPEDTKPGQ